MPRECLDLAILTLQVWYDGTPQTWGLISIDIFRFQCSTTIAHSGGLRINSCSGQADDAQLPARYRTGNQAPAVRGHEDSDASKRHLAIAFLVNRKQNSAAREAQW